MKIYSSQRGIALLTILVMVALATILAATIAKRQTNTSENTGYLMRQDQSLLYAKSAEAFFSELLIQDSDNGGNIDHLQENWAKPMPAFPVEDGFISGRLLDESGKFNLNNLLKADGSVDDSARRWFEKLLQRVGLPAELSQAVIDWQDQGLTDHPHVQWDWPQFLSGNSDIGLKNCLFLSQPHSHQCLRSSHTD